MARYFLQVAYDGTAFNGSQIQGEQDTVQLFIDKALSILLKKPTASFGASRTDAGVHAECNFYHFDAAIDDIQLFQYKMNALLPQSLCVKAIIQSQNPEANARFDAVSRRYRYKIHFSKNPFLHHRSYFFPFALDLKILEQTAEILKNYQDFETFCKRNHQSFTTLCQIMDSHWETTQDGIEYVVTANRFLRGMVRGLVGTQLQVARGKYDVAEFEKRIQAKDCTLADFSVPGHGLYLEQITFPENYFLREK